jgi:hypothetical protein
MSRAVFIMLLLCNASAFAQSPDKPVEEVAELVKTRSTEIITVEDGKKCPEVVESDGIVVCAEIDNGEDQLIFSDQRVKESSGAKTNADAAACIPGTGCRVPPSGGVTIGFGKRRPPAIPFEEVLKGLPEPDAVVPEEPDYEGLVPLPEPATPESLFADNVHHHRLA